MLYALRLEDIGATRRKRLRSAGVGAGSAAWVAEIVGRCPRYGLAREFLRPRQDYRHANKTGDRGVFRYYFLEPGRVYEVSEPINSRKVRRYFCTVSDGELTEVSRDEVEQWIENAA